MIGLRSSLLLLAVAAFACRGFGDMPGASSTNQLKSDRKSGPVVATESGSVLGAYAGPIAVFKGIPFARPPIGKLRWRPPQPLASWHGIRDAVQPGNYCVQDPAGLIPFLAPMAKAYGGAYQGEPVRSSEDCLYLNVWSPTTTPQHGLPVMVWLHGGSNTIGSGAQTTYDGYSLAAHSVILVTINYRLGVLGFFSHPELTAESPHHSSGNYGLLDEIAALAWVQRNIASFGGDPKNVTLFGESAGAINAGSLMTSPLSYGLFRRVISESGPAFGKGQPLSEAEGFGAAVGAQAPGDSHISSLERLRQMPATDVIKLAAQVAKSRGKGTDGGTLDGWVLTKSTQDAFVTGSIQNVDLLIGLNARELSAFRVASAAAGKSVASQSNGGTGALVKKFTEAAHPFFGAWTDPAVALYVGKILVHQAAGLDEVANDIMVACPVGSMASLTAAIGQRVYVYRFERTVPGKGEADLGAFHSLEVPYVFGTLRDPSWSWLPFGSVDQQLSASIQTYWTNFAKTGNPNSTGLPNWPNWSDRKQEFLQIDKNGAIAGRRNFGPFLSGLTAVDLRKNFR